MKNRKLDLENFLEENKKKFEINMSGSAGHNFEISEENLISYFEILLPHALPEYIAWSDEIEDYIKKSPEHTGGHTVFDYEATTTLLQMGYYFGECLIKGSKTLKWSTGQPGFVAEGLPVITGFINETECPPITVCINIVRKISRGTHDCNEFLLKLQKWRQFN